MALRRRCTINSPQSGQGTSAVFSVSTTVNQLVVCAIKMYFDVWTWHVAAVNSAKAAVILPLTTLGCDIYKILNLWLRKVIIIEKLCLLYRSA